MSKFQLVKQLDDEDDFGYCIITYSYSLKVAEQEILVLDKEELKILSKLLNEEIEQLKNDEFLKLQEEIKYHKHKLEIAEKRLNDWEW